MIYDRVNSIKLPVILGTDQNIDYLKQGINNTQTKLLDLSTSLGFLPLITRPTRVTDKTSTLIDNIYVSPQLYDNNRSAQVLEYDLSDHYPCLAYFRTLGKCQRDLTFQFRNCNNKILQDIANQLALVDWFPNQLTDLNASFDKFTETIYTSFNNNCPLITKTIAEHSVLKENWMTKTLLNKSRLLQRTFRKVRKKDRGSLEYRKYCQERNEYNRLKRKMKLDYFTTLITQAKNNTQKMWAIVNSQLTTRNPPLKIPEVFKVNNVQIIGNENIANEFNKFFSKVGENTANGLPPATHSFEHFLTQSPQVEEDFTLTMTTPDEIVKIIDSLKNSNSCGADNISTKIIKAIKQIIALPLSELINFSFRVGQFPSSLKISIVKPVFKKGAQDNLGNYRPISLLSVTSKIFERAFANRLKTFLNSANILTQNQYGFRKNYSTIDAIAQLVGDIILAFEKNEQVVATMLDISKAFDTINHATLLTKLQYYGIRNTAANWLKSYLENRLQVVNVADKTSAVLPVRTGVPQGSVLGPLLFVLYVNDIQNCLTSCKILQYADDTTIYFSGNAASDIYKMNTDLDNLQDWLLANKLALSVNKTTSLVFHSRGSNLDTEALTVSMGGSRLLLLRKLNYWV